MMKRILTIILINCSAFLSFAQTAESLLPETEIPKWEFTVNGMGGVSTLYYKVTAAEGPGQNSPKWNPSFTDWLGGGAGLGFIVHFNKHWGLSTGFDAVLYRSKIYSKDGFIISGPEPGDIIGTFYKKANFMESQRIVELELPLMLQFMTPVGSRKINNFYVEAGARLGYSLQADYFQKGVKKIKLVVYDNGRGLTPNEGNPIVPRWAEDSSYSFKLEPQKGSFGMQLNVMGAIETGIRWRIKTNLALYTGIYANVGLINPVKGASYSYLYKEKNGIESESHSILETKQEPYLVEEGGLFPIRQNQELMTSAHRTLAGGVRLRLAFGKASRPAPIIIPAKPDTVVVTNVVTRVDTVEKVKVVHDTVTIVKEIPVEIKQTMIEISNTLFAFNKFNLNEDAQRGLDKVAVWLNENPKLNVEISGHTDGKGTQEYNQKLSESRAKAVYDYFVEHGVKADRLSYKGYGKMNPIADNSTEAGRKKNRRVELNILNF